MERSGRQIFYGNLWDFTPERRVPWANAFYLRGVRHLRIHSWASILQQERTDVLQQVLAKSQSREIGCYNDRIALKFDRHQGAVKFQSDWKSLNPSVAASRLHEILQWSTRPLGDVVCLISWMRSQLLWWPLVVMLYTKKGTRDISCVLTQYWHMNSKCQDYVYL